MDNVTMPTGTRYITVAVAALFLFFAAACSKESAKPRTDHFAYTPTGDALWDRYAEALLEQLPGVPADFGIDSTDAAILPDQVLTQWEDEFQSDPRYWEPRFYNKVLRDSQTSLRHWDPEMFEWTNGYTLPDSAVFLIEGQERGATSPDAGMLLYQFHDWRLDYLRDNFGLADEIHDDYLDLPQFEDEVSRDERFDRRKRELADKLVEDYPDESWAWYQRAMRRFSDDAWEKGLNDLRAGNAAKVNRRPVCFPMSYITAHAGDELAEGNRMVAGMVAESFDLLFGKVFSDIPMYQFYDTQIERIGNGSDTAELEVWHEFAKHYGSMQSLDTGDWLGAIILPIRYAAHLEKDTPERVNPDQLAALKRLDSSARSLMNEFMERLKLERPTIDSEEADIREVLLEYGLDKDPSEVIGIGREEIELQPELNMELHRLHLCRIYDFYTANRRVLAEYGPKLSAELSEFDFTTLSWRD